MPEIKLGNLNFHNISLSDKGLYEKYIEETSYPLNLWSGNFPFIWAFSQSPKRKVLWKIIDKMLVTFVLTKRKRLYLFCLPFGSGEVEKLIAVLQKSLKICTDWNIKKKYKTKVRTLNSCQLEYLKNSEQFDDLFTVQRLKGTERHYSIKDLINLKGKKFASLRQSINKFQRLFPETKFREYENNDYQKVIKLNISWEKEAGSKYATIFDKLYFEEILENHKKLELIVLLADLNKEIVGINIGGILPNNQAWGCICKTKKGIEGLHETLIIKMVQKINKIDKSINYINVGSDLGIPGLIRFKEKFKPVLNLARYVLILK